ncbi:MAG: DUF4861 domain-containing protein [Dysgonamonadaceae bacterium]|jgi:hypothetical protein|nr:DUF4861 domain-containing protein [Dysgonamonadaceae bacterium]
MKRNLFLAVFVLLLTACVQKNSIKIEITNTSNIDRTESIVEIDRQSFAGLNPDSIIVLNDKGIELPHQILYNGRETPQTLLFPATVPANSKSTYTLKAGIPCACPAKTFGRQVPERKDDFAWENDRVVYRVYGPALADEYPSNGYDLWLKKTNALIINQFYKDDLSGVASYHVDHGEGLDCYKVGHTLGAGAIAPFADNKIWVENHYTTVKVLDCGILRTSFELTYDSVLVKDKVLSEKLIISLDAGSQFNKAEVQYSGDCEKLNLAAGIYLHDKQGIIFDDLEKGIFSYSENAVSDAGVPAGRNYVGLVFTTSVKNIFQDEKHIAGVLDYSCETPLVYYFGGGWSQWGFDSDKDWQKYVEKYAEMLRYPLEINILK